MRLGSEALSEELMKAVTAAIDDVAHKITETIGGLGSNVDPLELARRHDSSGVVARAMEDFQRQSKDLQSTIDHVMRQLR